jgi:hypothetical protein
MSLQKIEASNLFLGGRECNLSTIDKDQSIHDLLSPNILQYNMSRHAQDNEIHDSFKLSPCKIETNVEASQHNYMQSLID